MANDGGHLLLYENEYQEIILQEPGAQKYIRPFLGSRNIMNGEKRWCLWLVDASPFDIRGIKVINERVEMVKMSRLDSKRQTTRKLAKTPYLFGEIRQPETDYLLIPGVSSERRQYIPIGFLDKNTIASNLAYIVPNANLYDFGVLTSMMHMAWTRQVCGRLKGDYRYSNNIVYNNFPWPEKPNAAKIKRVEEAAQKVLDCRAKFPKSTLADLYDPISMPKMLVDAHRELDTAVDACYRSKAFTSELERLEFLFELYKKYTEPLINNLEGGSNKGRKTKGGSISKLNVI